MLILGIETSCDETAVVHARAFPQSNDRATMDTFLGVPSSPLYQDMKTGRQKYWLFRFRKPKT